MRLGAAWKMKPRGTKRGARSARRTSGSNRLTQPQRQNLQSERVKQLCRTETRPSATLRAHECQSHTSSSAAAAALPPKPCSTDNVSPCRDHCPLTLDAQTSPIPGPARPMFAPIADATRPATRKRVRSESPPSSVSDDDLSSWPNYPHRAEPASVSVARSHSAGPGSLHAQHLAVMTAILHTSLLKGDYARAGRAFGLLLRQSSAIDLRPDGRWGIGVDILLNRDRARPLHSRSRRTSPSPSPSNSPASPVRPVAASTTDYTAAKTYFEQLILQYPYHPSRPTAIDTRTFYPAFFSLCIHEATTHSTQALAQLSPDEADADAKAEIKRRELALAQSIALRVDQIIVSPPYDRFVPLLRLRGQVGLWVADLMEGLLRAEDDDDEVDGGREVQRGRLEEERAKARARLRKVVELGGSVAQCNGLP